ncbi:MAG: sensor histidine kinase [Acidimicrobiia bacterium]
MTTSLTDRFLRRLRWSLTALFAAATLLALAVLVVVAVRIDSDLRWSAMGETLLSQAQLAGESIYFDADRAAVGDRFLADESLTGGWPQVWVFEFEDDGVLALVGPSEDWFGLELGEAAARVAFDDVDYTAWVGVTDDGVEVYGRGVPLVEPESGTVRAVAFAVANREDFYGDHGTFRSRMVAAAAGLTALAAWAGFWMAGRGTAATAAALAQQERLLSDAAHELRTPVARILAVAESGLAGDEPAETALARVVRMGADAGQMVDDMLVLARMDAGREELTRQPLRLDLLAEEVASGYDDVTVAAVETVVEGDAGLLRRAISNLVRNAVEHGGSDVKVTVYPTRVVVTDTGPGVPPEAADLLFERFHSGPGSGGHGLGLPIVRWIAEAHGGSAGISNRPGGGAEAVLDL